jgi:hypothetical protein
VIEREEALVAATRFEPTSSTRRLRASNETNPPAHETASRQAPPPEPKAAPRQPAQEAKKQNPPPKETKPSKEAGDKEQFVEKSISFATFNQELV